MAAKSGIIRRRQVLAQHLICKLSGIPRINRIFVKASNAITQLATTLWPSTALRFTGRKDIRPELRPLALDPRHWSFVFFCFGLAPDINRKAKSVS